MVCSQDFLAHFLNRQFRLVKLPAIHHGKIAVIEGIIPSILTTLDGKIALAAKFPCALLVLCLDFRIGGRTVALHHLTKLGDMIDVPILTQIKMIIVQMLHTRRVTAAIGAVNLNYAVIRHTVEIIVVAVDEPDIISRNCGVIPDAPPADTRLRNGIEVLQADLLNRLAVIAGKLKQIPVPGGRNGVLTIRRKILFGNLTELLRLTSGAVVGGKTDTGTVFPQMQESVPIDEIEGFVFLLHQRPPSNSRENLLRPSASVDNSTVAL